METGMEFHVAALNAIGTRWRFLATFFGSCICSEPRAAHFRPAF